MFTQKNQDTAERQNRIYTLEDFLSGGENVETEEIQEEEEEKVAATESTSEPAEEEEEQEAIHQQEEEESEEEQRANPSQDPTVYADLLTNYIEEGDWEDALVEIDGEEIQLSQITSLDKETFLQIKATQKQIQQEKLKERYIDIDGLNETDLQLINLKKSGGDWTYLLQQEADNVHPLQGLDLDNENTQLWLLSEQYKSQGMDPEAIRTQLEFDKKNFKLDEKAKKVIDNINTSFEQMVAAENQRKQEELQQQQERRKELTKNLRETYKGMQLSDAAVKRYVETATKDLGGGRTKLDEIIKTYKEDPEKLAKLAYFLEDEKGFLEFNGAKQKNKQSLRTIKLISQTQKRTKDIAKNQDMESDDDPWSKMEFKKPQAK